ncbi:putative E3 ubiquitin-protein ligase XBAT35 [Bienertia sinuspersici]
MEEQGQITSPLSQQPCINNDFAPSSSSSSASQPVETERTEVPIHEVQLQQQNDTPWCLQWEPSLVFERFTITVGSDDVKNDVWCCVLVLLTFWFFAASVILILGLYGSFDIQLGPNCSFLIEANPFFVHSIQARQIDDQTDGLMLYGLHESPSLDVETIWSQNHTVSIDPTTHKEWAYYLNSGSKIHVSYDVKFPESASLLLVIAQGKHSLSDWIYAPSYNSTMSWNMIHGIGRIAQDITESDTYFVAVGNLNLETVEVYLNLTINSLLYNTTTAKFKCSLKDDVCDFDLIFLKPNAAVLSSPGPAQVNSNVDWYIQVSYGPQWVTYFGGSCIMSAIIFALFRYFSVYQSDSNDNQPDESAAVREPFLYPKDNDHTSLGSSYDSIPSDDDQDLDEKMIFEGSDEGKVSKEGEIHSLTTRRLCVICFDATRDCFFLPCGHCAACFSCGSRIAEEAGTCPICRRKMKKVRKIFAV